MLRLSKDQIVVHLGKYSRKRPEQTDLELKIGGMAVHPKFNRRTFQNDIGIIKLKHKITLDNVTRPICLPTSGK